MPKYAVVVCSQCKNAFIIEPGPRTVSCRSCNRRYEAARLRVFFASDDFKEAQDARASVVAGISGDSGAYDVLATGGALSRDVMERLGSEVYEKQFLEDKRKVDEIMKKEAHQTRKMGQQSMLKEAFEELSRNGDVSIEDYWEKVSFHGISRQKFDQWVDKMLDTGVACSPKYGYLRKI